MKVTVEISYYALQEDYNSPVLEFLDDIVENRKVTVETGVMSTVISSEYDEVMLLLIQTIRPFMEKYPSVFTFKIANACKVCKNEG